MNAIPTTSASWVEPGINIHVKQVQQKNACDRCTQGCTFSIDAPVYVRNFGQGDTLIPGIVTAKLKSVWYEVELENGKRLWRHLNHIRSRTDTQLDSLIPSSHSWTNWADSVQSSSDPPVPQVYPPEESSTCHYHLRYRHPPGQTCNVALIFVFGTSALQLGGRNCNMVLLH